jgi:hypothetical protein
MIDEKTRLVNSGLVEEFVAEKNGEWNHEDWLAFLSRVREAGYHALTDDEIGALLELRKVIFRARSDAGPLNALRLGQGGRRLEPIPFQPVRAEWPLERPVLRSTLQPIDTEYVLLQPHAPLSAPKAIVARVSTCAVCDPSVVGTFVMETGPRGRIVSQIIAKLQLTGSFSVGSLRQFWKEFRAQLCATCQSTLDSIDVDRRQAVALLEEAVRLDPKNEPAKKNLAVARSLL